MPMDSLLILFHLLVFAYWLGGDIGVFYASTLLTDNRRDVAGRITAAKILADVDLAPRFCLLLAMPTGLAVAASRGWLTVGPIFVVSIFVVSVAWISLVWTLHKTHGTSANLKLIDTSMRWLFLIGLVGTGVTAIAGAINIPLFIALKLLLLGFAVSMGLLVRRVLVPFGPAFAKLANGDGDAETDQTIKQCLDRARPAVVAIWAALIAAAWLGVTTPV